MGSGLPSITDLSLSLSQLKSDVVGCSVDYKEGLVLATDTYNAATQKYNVLDPSQVVANGKAVGRPL